MSNHSQDFLAQSELEPASLLARFLFYCHSRESAVRHPPAGGGGVGGNPGKIRNTLDPRMRGDDNNQHITNTGGDFRAYAMNLSNQFQSH